MVAHEKGKVGSGMRAAVVTESGTFSWEDRPEPRAVPGTAVIRPLFVGICGTDLHGFRGGNPFLSLPRVFGHEVVAEVVEAPGGDSSFSPGDSVVVNPMLTCGRCYPCRIGRRNCCVEMRVVGVHIDGGLQEKLALPTALLHHWPAHIPVVHGALCEPLSVGLQAVRRGGVRSDDRVVIIGAGTIGLAVLLMAKHAGATVLITDTHANRLRAAESLGADRTVNVSQEADGAAVAEFTDGEGASVVIEAAGLAKTVEHSVDLVSAAGRVVILGITNQPVRLPAGAFIRKEIDFRASRLNADLFPRVLEMLERGTIQPSPIITHHFAFARVREAFGFAESRPGEAIKIVVQMTEDVG